MSNLSHYLNDYPDVGLESLSLEELSFTLENIDEELLIAFATLETHNDVTGHAFDQGLESIDDTMALKYYPDLEDLKESKATGGTRGGPLPFRMWDDWFTRNHRIVQGIVDLLRKKEDTIKAYRKKLANKKNKLNQDHVREYDSLHKATFVGIEKYWLYPNGKHPNDILKAVEKDHQDTTTYLEEVPGNVEKAFGDLLSVLKGAKGGDVREILDKKASSLSKPEDLVPKGMVNNTSSYLYRTALLVGSDKKTKGSPFEKLSTPSKVKLISGTWGNSVLSAALAYFNLTPGGLVALVIRGGRATPFNVRTKDLIELEKLANGYLYSAEKGIDTVKKSLKNVNGQTEGIRVALAGGEVDKNTIRMVTRYISNINALVLKPYSQLTSRQIKMAKAINYLLIRTVNR